MLRRISPWLALSLAASWSRAGEFPTSLQELLNSTGASLAAAPTRMISGRCSTAYEISDFVSLPPPNDDVLVSLTVTHAGQCLMGHLGLTAVAKTETVTFDDAGGHVRDGTVRFTAANGDQLRALESADIGPLDADGGFSFTGS